MIGFKPLLKLLIDKGMKKQDLIEAAGLSRATIAKLSKNDPVSMDVIDRLCAALNCQPGDLLEYVPDNKQ